MSEKQEPKLPENFGPAAMLRTLEELGKGDGPLANAIRHELASPRKNSNCIFIGATFRGLEDDKF